jgi:hypothetical protein
MIGLAAAEEISQLGQCRPYVDEAQAANRTARIVAGQQAAECRPCLNEVVAIPERRPRDQHQEQPRFEQKGDEEEPPEQRSASRLRF